MSCKCTYSNDSLQNLLGLCLLIAVYLEALYVMSDVVEQRTKVGSLKELIKCNELESYRGAITERGGQRSSREFSASLKADGIELLSIGTGKAVRRGDPVGSRQDASQGRADEACRSKESGKMHVCFRAESECWLCWK